MRFKSQKLGRRTIAYSVHAQERYFERADRHVRGELEADLEQATWSNRVPTWAHLNTWHRGRAEGAVMLDEGRAFIVNRNANGQLVAVTYVERPPVPAA